MYIRTLPWTIITHLDDSEEESQKLVQEEILEKEENLYFLTPRGHYFGDIIFILEKIGFSDPGSRIKVLKYDWFGN